MDDTRPPDQDSSPRIPQVQASTDRYEGVQSAADVPVPDINSLGDPVIVIEPNGVLRFANPASEETLGWDRDEFVGRSVLDLVHPDDLALAAASLGTIVTKQVGDLIPIRVRTSRGTWIYLEIRGSTIAVGDEQLIALVARDTTHRNLHALDQDDVEVLRAVMANMHAMVLLVDVDGRVQAVNGAVTRLLGHDPELVKHRHFDDLVHEDDREQVLAAWQSVSSEQSLALDARFVAGDQSTVVCEFTVKNLLNDPVVGCYVFSGHVADALTDARDRVAFLAEHDARTGLLNRDGFMRSANDLIRAGSGLGLMVIDIEHFRSINELYGEPVGDRVLTAVAERIDQIRLPDVVTARFGGDEFVVAVRSADDELIRALRDRVRREVARPVVVDDQEINVAIRTAIAFESRPEVLDSLLVRASNELMSIKRRTEAEGTEGISFDAIAQRRRQVDHLRNALEEGQIQPFYQPIYDQAGRIISVEALVRWVHPLRGVLGTGEILPLAQLAGLASVIDEQVLETALQFAVRLAAADSGVMVHVNVDPKVIAQAAFGALFLDRCHRIGADPARLVIEITETDLLAPGASSLSNMQTLRRAGIHVFIDDFGTGYSSLAHLLELPVDGVKIDRRFVAGIDVESAATNLTTAILGLSERMNLSCVAEGVEQPYQRERLGELGCKAFQGWLYSEAVSAQEIMAMIPVIVPDVAQTSQRTSS